jgi:hypothetical protein
MPLSISNAAPISGDGKLIYSKFGTLPTGAGVIVSVDNFTLPKLSNDQYLMIIFEVDRPSGASNLVCSFNLANNAITIGDLAYTSIASGGTRMVLYVIQSVQTANRCDIFGYNHLASANVTSANSAALGDMSIAKTIYLNFTDSATSTFIYSTKIMLFGSGVKG